jgi:multidrug resistance efflux pump
METKELMAQNVQDPAQAGEVLLQPPKRPKKKRSIKKIVLLSLAGIAVLALAGNAVLSALRGPLPTYVQTQTAAAGDISQSLSTTGTLTSGQTVVVPSPVTAPLAEVKVEAGQIVNAGDLLATFDTEPLERAYRQASAAYESGQLQKSDALTASDSAQARFNDAAANLNNLAVQKDKASAAVNSLTAQYEALADKQSEEALSVKAALDAAAADLANQQQALSAAKATYDAEKQAVLSDSAKRQLELAQVPSSLSVQSAKEDLARGRDGVTAPISGVVTSLSAVPGSSAAAYGPLCTIQSLSDGALPLRFGKGKAGPERRCHHAGQDIHRNGGVHRRDGHGRGLRHRHGHGLCARQSAAGRAGRRYQTGPGGQRGHCHRGGERSAEPAHQRRQYGCERPVLLCGGKRRGCAPGCEDRPFFRYAGGDRLRHFRGG